MRIETVISAAVIWAAAPACPARNNSDACLPGLVAKRAVGLTVCLRIAAFGLNIRIC